MLKLFRRRKRKKPRKLLRELLLARKLKIAMLMLQLKVRVCVGFSRLSTIYITR